MCCASAALCSSVDYQPSVRRRWSSASRFEAAIMAGMAAFFANVFMIDGLARDKVLRDRCRHYERALRTIIANPTKAADYAQSALDMGTA